MVGRVTLAQWSDWLQYEIFFDREGDGDPVTTILVDDALLVRALAHGGIHLDETNARSAFLSAFPSRERMSGWFNGSLHPGSGLLAFLVLCCFAASEAAGTELNDYRQRLRLIMGWSTEITDCSALPKLWAELRDRIAYFSSAAGLRPLVLPDPRHRKQIGHAIELTFPSRQDARKLLIELERARELGIDQPESVLRWLSEISPAGRFSPSFVETFSDFRKAWRRGERSLGDHRFWTGWRMVAERWALSEHADCLQVLCDEWHSYELLSATGEPLVLWSAVRRGDLPVGLCRLVDRGEPIYLKEADWGRWVWAGAGPAVGRSSKAALIREASVPKELLARMERAKVTGAPGWSFTTSLDLLSRAAGKSTSFADELIGLTVSGAPRTDGGRLGRPSFPLTLTTSGPVRELVLSGELANRVELNRIGPNVWKVGPARPLEGELRLALQPIGVGEPVERSITLRRSALTCQLESTIPARFAEDEQGELPSATKPELGAQAAMITWPVAARITSSPIILDIIEYLATKSTPIGLGGMLELLQDTTSDYQIDPWLVLRALLEGGALVPLRVKGWRGRAVMSRAPRAVLCRTNDGFSLTLDGVINEVLSERFSGIARRMGLVAQVLGGATAWSIPTYTVEAPKIAPLVALAAELSLPLQQFNDTFAGPPLLSYLANLAPQVDGSGHSIRRKVIFPGAELLEQNGASVLLCERERDDAPRLWLVGKSADAGRFWSHRHYAILEACRITRLPAFACDGNVLRSKVAGAFLPLHVARWIRLACRAGCGPSEADYVYPITDTIAVELRSYLGSLLENDNATPSVIPRTQSNRWPRVAIATSVGPTVLPVWRWARSKSRKVM